MGRESGGLIALRDARERTIARLSEHFANDVLDVEEFDRRVSLVHRAATVAEIEKVVEDLPAAQAQPSVKPQTALVPLSQVRDKQSVVAILGGANRAGTWTCPRQLKVAVFLGGAVLDFREARLPAGVVEVKVFAMMGGVHIIVPPELAVDIGGVAVMGGFEQMERTPLEPDPERPVVRVHGFVLMGGVAVETRLPGEGERAARKRRRREREQREQRRLPAPEDRR